MRLEVFIMKNASMLSVGLFRNVLRRFWPLWLAGFAALFLAIDLPVYTSVSHIMRSSVRVGDRSDMLVELWSILRFLGFLYAFVGAMVVALALNDHLFDARSATFVGSIPARRGEVFNAVLAAGAVVLLGLPALAALLVLPLRIVVGTVFSLGFVIQWLACTVSLALVFYAFALLACQLSGARAVAVLLYLVVTLLPACLELAVRLALPALMYGVTDDAFVLDRITPAVRMAEAAIGITDVGMPRWEMIVPYLLVAALMAFCANVLYGRRDLETAGGSVSFGQIRPVLKYLSGISMALLFGSAYRLLTMLGAADGLPMRSGEVIVFTALLVVGAFLGILFAEMIMSRSARVLSKVWPGSVALACLVLAFVGACRLDAFGAARYVPKATEVERVQVYCDSYDDDLMISSAEGVERVCDLQRGLIAYGGAGERNGSSFTISLVYHLKGGRTVKRSYPVLTDYFAYRAGERSADMGALLIDKFAEIANSQEGRASRFASILGDGPIAFTIQVEYSLSDGTYSSLELSEAERAEFIEHGLKPDLMNELAGDVFGNLDLSPQGYDATMCVLEPLDEYGDSYNVLLNMELEESHTPNTIAWLREHHPEVELQL